MERMVIHGFDGVMEGRTIPAGMAEPVTLTIGNMIWECQTVCL